MEQLLIGRQGAGGKVNHNIHPHCNTGGISQAALAVIMSLSLHSVPLHATSLLWLLTVKILSN